MAFVEERECAQIGPNFEIRGGIESGSYRLAVLWRGLSGAFAGTSIVTIGETDPDIVEVPVSETIAIDGSVQAENGKVPDSLLVVIVTDTPDRPGISFSASVKPNGRFTLQDVLPGRYSIHLRRLPENVSVAGIRVGSREFAPDAVDLMPETASISIIIKQK